ncbi:MAG: restriction endonuclease subunit S [Candidatus Thorarchaeota archaeon]
MISKPMTKFKVTKAGNIPVDWEIRQIKQVAKFNELQISKSFIHKEIDYIDISSVKEGRIIEIKRTSKDQAPSRAKRVIRDNDILISTVRPNLKHYTFITKSSEKLIASTGFVVISAKTIDPYFLYYFLTSKSYTDFLAAIADTHTSAYPSFTPDVIERTFVPFPPIIEQKKIGNVLSAFDDKIKLNCKINKTIKSIGSTLFKHWFRKFRFYGNSQKLLEKSHKWRSKDLKIGSIGDIIQIQAGFAFKSKDFLDQGTNSIVKIKNISEDTVNIKDTQFISKETASNLDKRFLIDSGAVLIAMTGANVGKIGIVPKTDKSLWLNQRVGIFREKVEYGKYFIFFLLSSNKYQRILKNMAKGTAQPNISSSDIESIEIVLPPQEEIKNFGCFFDPFFQYLISNLNENEKLSEIRDKLTPTLLSGKYRFNNSRN